jgi:hypothetical protein
MSYSTFVHSGIVNPSKPNLTKKTSDSMNIIEMDISLLTKILESVKENVQSSEDLDHIVTNIIDLKNKGVLTISDYNQIISNQKDQNPELVLIKKLAGI